MIVLPFFKEMECVMKNFFKKYNTNVVFSTINKLNSIIILGKDKNVKYNNANLVYKINCNNCNASYVGQTSRRLNVRIKEHKKSTVIETKIRLYLRTTKIITTQLTFITLKY